MNGGTCHRGPSTGYTCRCAGGFEGNTVRPLSIPSALPSCNKNMNTPLSVQCQVDICASSPCLHGGICTGTSGGTGPGTHGGYSCACSGTGHQGLTCSTCKSSCESEEPDKSTKACARKSCAASSCPADQCYSKISSETGTCRASCRTGYSGTAATYECSSAGAWVAKTAGLSCSADSCGGSPTPHSESVSGTFEDGHPISATCSSGYYSVETGTYSCQLTGSGGNVGWLPTGESPGRTCLPKKCSGNPTKGDQSILLLIQPLPPLSPPSPRPPKPPPLLPLLPLPFCYCVAVADSLLLVTASRCRRKREGLQ